MKRKEVFLHNNDWFLTEILSTVTTESQLLEYFPTISLDPNIGYQELLQCWKNDEMNENDMNLFQNF
jgi:hypothetical protein